MALLRTQVVWIPSGNTLHVVFPVRVEGAFVAHIIHLRTHYLAGDKLSPSRIVTKAELHCWCSQACLRHFALWLLKVCTSPYQNAIVLKPLEGNVAVLPRPYHCNRPWNTEYISNGPLFLTILSYYPQSIHHTKEYFGPVFIDTNRHTYPWSKALFFLSGIYFSHKRCYVGLRWKAGWLCPSLSRCQKRDHLLSILALYIMRLASSCVCLVKRHRYSAPGYTVAQVSIGHLGIAIVAAFLL